MAFIPAICPSCGGSLQVPDNRDQVKCMYCGSDVIVRQAVQLASGTNVKNLMELAESAVASANYKESFDYYTKILEADPTNAAAWFGKGESAGWMSTLNDLKTTEMIVGFNNAIKHAPEAEKQQWQRRAAEGVSGVTTACYSMARNHVIEFVAVDNQWAEYLGRCQLLLSTLEVGHAYDPNNRTIIESIIQICADNISGLQFKNFEGYPQAVFLTDQYEGSVRGKMNEYVAKMQNLDPNFKQPKVKRASAGPCFVVTATLGEQNHPMVINLRRFRDTWLIRWRAGRLLVRVYNRCGPTLARTVENNPALRGLSLFLFVWPLTLIARLAIKNVATEHVYANDFRIPR